MGSLAAHLVEAGDHGRLRFHPSCPVCRRERLFGTLSSEPVVSRRAQAVLAGGLLAVSSAAPGAALAQEPDRQSEGLAAPEHPSGVELDDPGFDPGGDTVLPFDTAPAPAPPSPDGEDLGEGAPLDAEPLHDPDARLVPLTEAETPGEETPVPPSESVPPEPPAAETPADTSGEPPAAGDESPVAPAPPEHPPLDGESDPEPRTTRPDRERDASRAGSQPEPSGGAPLAPAPYVAPAPAAAPVPATRPVAEVETATSQRHIEGAFYVVQPGDSLWAIAKRLLGADASPAQIAREVHRLWSLNEERIATGDPDLLMVGTKLRLR